MQTIEEKKKQRYQFLKKLYDKTNGSENIYVTSEEITDGLNINKEAISNIIDYLIEEHLIAIPAFGVISITHYGICEVEAAESNPNKPTEHFLPLNIISIGNMTNSQIQQASPQAIQQYILNENKVEELKDIIASLKESMINFTLQPQQIADLESEIMTIEAQTTHSQPKSIIINTCLDSINRILESIASNVIASGLITVITNYLAK